MADVARVIAYILAKYDSDERIFIAELGDYKTLVISTTPIKSVQITWGE